LFDARKRVDLGLVGAEVGKGAALGLGECCKSRGAFQVRLGEETLVGSFSTVAAAAWSLTRNIACAAATSSSATTP
jgi:hypothetical protein